MRAFVALEIPPTVRDAVERTVGGLQGLMPDARWVAPGNYHLTLRFLGEIDDALRSRLEVDLEATFVRHAPFSLRLGGSGAFPEGRPARVVWIGCVDPRPLAPLAADVLSVTASSVDESSRRRDARFFPHVTVARCRSPWREEAVGRWRAAIPGPLGGPFDVTRGVLMKSRLASGGPTYELVRAFPLGGG